MGKIKQTYAFVRQTLKNYRKFPTSILFFEICAKLIPQVSFFKSNIGQLFVEANTKRIDNFLFEQLPELNTLIAKINLDAPSPYRPTERVIWQFWGQGTMSRPPLVEKCMDSVQKNSRDCEVRILTLQNYSEWVTVPDVILNRFHERKMSITHFSDYLRSKILAEYGGIWLDATIYMSSKIDENYFSDSFFSVKPQNNVEPSGSVAHNRWATFTLGTWKNDRMMIFVAEAFELYWKQFDSSLDYLLIDYLMDIATKKINGVGENVDLLPTNNKHVYNLQPLLGEAFEDSKPKLDKLLKDTKLFKLTYKSYSSVLEAEGTVYSIL